MCLPAKLRAPDPYVSAGWRVYVPAFLPGDFRKADRLQKGRQVHAGPSLYTSIPPDPYTLIPLYLYTFIPLYPYTLPIPFSPSPIYPYLGS